MLTLLWVVAIILGICVLAYNRASILVWTIAGFVGLIIVSMLSPFSIVSLVILWFIYFALTISLNKTVLRRNYLARPLSKFYRHALPKMSQTERQALEVGTVQWAGELFNGAPDWQGLINKKSAKISIEEQTFLDVQVEELCKMLDDWDITHKRMDLSPEIWTFLKENGFFAFIIPKKFGGLEFSATANSEIITKVAGFSVTTASIIAVPNSLGPAELLLKYGTEEQKNYYLPRLAKGEEIPCFALTGPEAGSDAASIPDTGIVCKQTFEGNEITGIKLNFSKRYITLAPVATVIGLAFKLFDPENLLGEQEELGITCALLPRNTPGIEIGRRHFPLNIPFQNGPIQGVDVFIPLDWIIGGSAMIGRGWAMLVECLSVGRGISLPAMAIGSAKVGLRATSAYARIRYQFGIPIGKFGGVEEALVRAIGNLYIMEAAREMTTAAIDSGEKPAVLTAVVKYHLTERGRQISNDLMDINAGKGICLGPNNYIGRHYQSVPIGITVEGANILTRSLIIFGQGVIRCHPYILAEMHAALDLDKHRGLIAFDKLIFNHLGLIFSNFIRTLCLAFTSSRIVIAPKSSASRYFQHLTRFSSAFAFLSDVTISMLGGALKSKEKLSARLGDVFSLLYLGSAVLKRFHEQGEQLEDTVIMQWACQQILHDIQSSIDGVLRNFPNRWVATILRIIIFPLGKHFHPPRDKLGHGVAKLFIEPSTARDRLTGGICLDINAVHPLGRIEEALKLMLSIKPIEQKITQAKMDRIIKGVSYDALAKAALTAKVIDSEEYSQIITAHKARMAVIQVDDFDPKELASTAT